MLSTELDQRASLTPDGKLEKGGKTPGRTTLKVLEVRHNPLADLRRQVVRHV